jgi:hypothetical protein
MDNKIDKAKGFVKLAIKKIDIFIAESNFNEISQEKIMMFKENLQGILLELESGNLPPKGERRDWMGHVIVDSWPWPSSAVLLDLSETILAAEQAYSTI